MLDRLFERFDRLVVLDTETTGVRPRRDEIIELGLVTLDREGAVREEDYLIRLEPGRRLPAEIVRLTGITDEMLRTRGGEPAAAGEALERALSSERPLVAAYNAQFDLCFLYYFLRHLGRAELLRRARFLDVLSVYKDRRDYPHRLSDAVAAYGVETANTHRACDDARASLEVLQAMEREQDDVHLYINLFGFNPRYGVSGPRISSVRYEPQPYDRRKRLYE